jgi:phosphoribosyl 1,2-cyclic phosphodiesterase
MSDNEEAAPGDGFWVRFWGVRGSIPCANAAMARYGGNTACLEVRCGTHTLVFDLGSGAPNLGRDLLGRGVADIDVFITHAHLDHVVGLPFFSPFYRDEFSARMWAGPLSGAVSTRDMVQQLMREPFLPITPDIFRAAIDYRDLKPGSAVTPHPGIAVSTIALNHPGGCLGYRVDFAGKSICYISDTEHVPGQPDHDILSFIAGADIVIYDATFTDEEFMPCRGYGHSTWREGAALCDTAGADLFVVFHHHTEHDDATMDAIGDDLRRARPNSVVAREGLILTPRPPDHDGHNPT